MNRLVRLGSSIQELSKTQSFKFWFDYVKPKYGQKRCLCIWIQMFHCIRKKMIFIKTFHKMLKLGLILQIINYIDHCLKKKIKNDWINER